LAAKSFVIEKKYAFKIEVPNPFYNREKALEVLKKEYQDTDPVKTEKIISTFVRVSTLDYKDGAKARPDESLASIAQEFLNFIVY
jgi:hypothetical protein